ncbi:cytochrome P450 [Chitinivorax sp. B]|uniref:cytochrome P450 n=1 Tax=Chitinivorax sp. B TaxID=2502235 RepID=UPI0010F72EAA|nr:cytochrome P450 [Chitinivorax sp. B]
MTAIPTLPCQHFGIKHWTAIQKDPLAWLDSVHEQFPDIALMRIGIQRVWCVFHPDGVRSLLIDHRSHLKRWQPSLCMMQQWNGRSFFVKEGDVARSGRQTIRPLLNPAPLHEVWELAEQWGQRWQHGQVIDLNLELAALCLTLSGHVLFQVDLSPHAYRLAKAVKILSRVGLLETSTGIPLGHWFPSRLCPLKRWALRQIHDTLDEIAATSPLGLAPHRDELGTLLLAGHQSTGVTLTWSWLLLNQYPSILAEVRDEINAINWIQASTLKEIGPLTYLRAAVDESLRLYPPAYGLTPRQLTAPAEILGQSLKKGDLVMISAWVTQRDERWFENADQFRPNRGQTDARAPKGAFFPFGLGDRACPGTAMAMADLYPTLAYLLSHWDIQPLDRLEPQGWFSLRPKSAKVRLLQRSST